MATHRADVSVRLGSHDVHEAEPGGLVPGIPAPDLIGLDLATATEVAAALGLALNAVPTWSRRARPGDVVGQSPPPGLRMRAHWRIHVLVQAAATTDT